MKVIERGSDRRAQVNIYVDGQVAALEEYDQYIDPRDNAICCYVAINEGHKPRVGGRFTGTVRNTCKGLNDVTDVCSDSGRGL